MPVSARTRVRKNSTGTPDAVLDVNPQVWPVMAMFVTDAMCRRHLPAMAFHSVPTDVVVN